jgi:tetratricopeptide (TPR) repeat protein
MATSHKVTKRRVSRQMSRTRSKPLKKSNLKQAPQHSHVLRDANDAGVQAQLKLYAEAVALFQQQKFQRAKQLLEKVLVGTSKELSDRARVHLSICDQRIASAKPANAAPRTAEEHYTHGIAMMNAGRWDDAREHLDRALKSTPKSDHVVYAMAALDCLTGESESAMERLRLAIKLRPENRYQARNDADFAFLQEDPRFTELLYPERDGSFG